MRVLVMVSALAAAGCIKAATFQCSTSDQCLRDGVQGRCESISYCSFPDPKCASGERFGDYSSQYSNQCVGGGGDGGLPIDGHLVDGHLADGQIIDGLGCPAGYTALPGVPNRLYRKLLTAAPWANHKTACSAEGANVYLTIPDDMTELSAIVTFAGADVWVGIDDMANEGVYVTVLGMTPPYLPWGPGEPDNAGNQDCVQALAASTQLDTLQCNTQRIAVCECEP